MPSRSPRLRTGLTALVGWLLTRAAALALLVFVEQLTIAGDVFYYWRNVEALSQTGLPATLREYPTPVVWLLAVPYGLAGGDQQGYLVAFVASMLVLDAAFAVALWRSGGTRSGRALRFWILYPFLIGPLCYTRFDLVPAVLAGGAMLAARRRPGLAGALVGIGAAVKLWPALLVGAFAAPRTSRVRVVVGFVVAGFGLAVVSLVAGGPSRLFSPLTWQSGRGLQIESIWATPLLLARAVEPSTWAVPYSTFKAYEVFGPGVGPLLGVSTLATVLGLVVVLALVVRAFRAPSPSPYAVGLVVLATVAVTTVTNKTLSPQYLLWLGGPAAALLALHPDPAAVRQVVVTRLAGQLLVLAVLTQLVYPLLYEGLLGHQGSALLVVATAVTALRNLALLAFTVEVCRFAWTSTRRRADAYEPVQDEMTS